MGKPGANRPVIGALNCRAHNQEKALRTLSCDSFGALVDERRHSPAVPVEEEGDERAQPELEEAHAENGSAS